MRPAECPGDPRADAGRVAPPMRCHCRAGLSTLINDPDHYGFSLRARQRGRDLVDLTNALSCHCEWREVVQPCLYLQERRYWATSVCPNESVAAKPPRQKSHALSDNTAWLLADML